MEENRNFILAIALSIVILIGWQYFFGVPQMQKEQAKQDAQQRAQTELVPGEVPKPETAAPSLEGDLPRPDVATGRIPVQSGAPGTAASRDAALVSSKRIVIDTPVLKGSIALTGARIDDIRLLRHTTTVKPDSAPITLLSPSGGPNAYYAEYGWVPDAAAKIKAPGAKTQWSAQTQGPLTPEKPVTLVWDNGEGMIFRRTISVDENSMFTIAQEVENKTDKPVTLYPYALISRHGTPKIQGFYILHEGLVGFLGEEGLQEIDYDDLRESQSMEFRDTGGWLGITDKYWAAVLVPDQKSKYKARFSARKKGGVDVYQTDYLLDAVTVAPGARTEVTGRLFAGSKEVSIIDGYQNSLGIDRFELMIDWGWFYFLTKPLFYALDFFFKLLGNFGVAILIVTVIIKIIFFPLQNKSYAAMSKMKKLQPEISQLRERFPDDKARQQQGMMELYKKEKVNPMSGCLPVIIQIPVFFALYKVLFVSIEMRHAPFFGWIQDLSAPDPTSLFNLFGLIPWQPPAMMMIGVWPLVMGISMFVQMRLNPTPADPIQKQIFTWMPLMFTIMLATFPAGLVIYWTWNNILSIAQQWFIMNKHGVKVTLIENIKPGFLSKGGGKDSK